MSDEITKLKRVEKGRQLHAERVAAWDKKAQWQKSTRDVLAFALFALVLAGLYSMMPANEVEPVYTPPQPFPTFLAMATAAPLLATPTLAPTATDTTTPQATNTGTASPTATSTATSTPTRTPRPAYAIVKVVTAVSTPLPPLDFEPLRFPVSIVAYVFTAIVLWSCSFACVYALYSIWRIKQAKKAEQPSSSEILSPPTWQPVTINIHASQPVTRAPLAEDTDAITVWPDVSDDFSPRGELATSPTPAENEQETLQNDPVSRVTPETRAALLFERAAKNGGVPLFSGDKMPEEEEWGDIHALYQNLLALEFGRGKGGAKKATYEILWGRSAAGGGTYDIYSDKMLELDKEDKNE